MMIKVIEEGFRAVVYSNLRLARFLEAPSAELKTLDF